MDQSSKLGFLPLPVAAAMAYREVTGKSIDTSPDPRAREVLCDVAHALSILAPLYMLDGSAGEARELLPILLMGATFEKGASVIRLKNGEEQGNVGISRTDLDAAVAILKECGFDSRWGASAVSARQPGAGAS